jgi:hypothetical protein
MSKNFESGKSNVVVGRNSLLEADLYDQGNIVIGNDKSRSAISNEPRMTDTYDAIVIGSGDIDGTNVSSALTRVPDGCLLVGPGARVPTDGAGVKLANTDNHIILDKYQAPTVGAPIPDSGIPIWYGGIRYLLSAEALP